MITRKRRTRQHVIADLSVNHVERFVLLCGYTAERLTFDYGYDLLLQTFDSTGQLEPGFVLIQMKATDVPSYVEENQALAFSLAVGDLDVWLAEDTPVFLVVYVAPEDKAYWLDIQGSVRSLPAGGRETYTVRVPVTQLLNQDAVEHFRTVRQVAVQKDKQI